MGNVRSMGDIVMKGTGSAVWPESHPTPADLEKARIWAEEHPEESGVQRKTKDTSGGRE